MLGNISNENKCGCFHNSLERKRKITIRHPQTNWNMHSYGHGLLIPKDHYSFQNHSNARDVISVGHGQMNSVMLPADLITALEKSEML